MLPEFNHTLNSHELPNFLVSNVSLAMLDLTKTETQVVKMWTLQDQYVVYKPKSKTEELCTAFESEREVQDDARRRDQR